MEPPTTPKPNATGGCSIGCASLFLLVGIVWPLLHLIGGPTPEPETLFGIPFLIGGPAFVAAHILALFAVNSRHTKTAAGGWWALRMMWGAIGAFLLLGLIAALLGF